MPSLTLLATCQFQARPSSHSATDVSTPLAECRAARFAYPSAISRPVLRGFDLTPYRGQTVAVVGPSGCGKSTPVSLLEQVYPLSSGQLLINGTDTSTVNPTTARSEISLVGQEPVLFTGSIRENILLGCKDEDMEESRLEEIAKQAQIYDLIQSLPDGWNTSVVPSAGVSLSGGRKQWIAIARALARQSNILLLDEATSTLDQQSEALIQKAIRGVGKKTGTLVIAHRLHTVVEADCIYMMDDGEVKEKGGHDELVSLGGTYTEMCGMQGLVV